MNRSFKTIKQLMKYAKDSGYKKITVDTYDLIGYKNGKRFKSKQYEIKKYSL